MSRFEKAYYEVVEDPDVIEEPFTGLPHYFEIPHLPHYFEIVVTGRPGILDYMVLPAWK